METRVCDIPKWVSKQKKSKQNKSAMQTIKENGIVINCYNLWQKRSHVISFYQNIFIARGDYVICSYLV